MIDYEKARIFNKNAWDSLRVEVDKEITKHEAEKKTFDDECYCSGEFLSLMIRKGLGKAPITTEEVYKLRDAL